jgi:hypothetical protein
MDQLHTGPGGTADDRAAEGLEGLRAPDPARLRPERFLPCPTGTLMTGLIVLWVALVALLPGLPGAVFVPYWIACAGIQLAVWLFISPRQGAPDSVGPA